MTPLGTTANSAIPAGARLRSIKDALDAGGGIAAGVIFIEPGGRVLLLRRSPTEENYAGHWAFPGGKADEGETAEDAARREVGEEIGGYPEGKPNLIQQAETPNGMTFHTFAQKVPQAFEPKLNGEHTEHAWAALDDLPSPLHPQVEKTLREHGPRLLGEDDDLVSFLAGDDFNESDHPRTENGQFGSGGKGSHGGPHHIIREKSDPGKRYVGDPDREVENRQLGIKEKPEDRTKHEGKKEISNEALSAKLKGMTLEKLRASASNKDVDPKIRAHVAREINSRLLSGATDSALRLALDKDSVRRIDKDGRLHIAEAIICQESVNPYRGSEIPYWNELGLDPDRIYKLYRPAEEIEKAAATSNGIQLMREHKPVSADDHKPYDVAGAVGTSARFERPNLMNAITIWPEMDIEGVESEKKRALSPGYHYKAVMEPGTFKGEEFQGRMTQIVFNHLCLVEQGRQGEDVIVGDSADPLLWGMIERAIFEM